MSNMSDSSESWDSFSSSSAMPTGNTTGKAPWYFLAIGAGVTLVLIASWFFVRPSGDFVVAGNLIYWVLSMAGYLVPFALFVLSEMQIRSKVTFYYTNPKTVSGVRGIYLSIGVIVSTVFALGAADELSRLLNTVN
jgi:hypothetical protein